MMTAKLFRCCLVSMTFFLFSIDAFAQTNPWPRITPDGMHREITAGLSVVYIKPRANFESYSRVNILEPVVRFRRPKDESERLSSDDESKALVIEKTLEVRREIAQAFRNTYVEKMASGGFEVTDEEAEDVLLVRPAIINIGLHASDAGASEQPVGEMTLYIEVFDSITGERLAEAWDLQEERLFNPGLKGWANEANRAIVQQMLDDWAQTLLNGFIRFAGKPGASSAGAN